MKLKKKRLKERWAGLKFMLKIRPPKNLNQSPSYAHNYCQARYRSRPFYIALSQCNEVYLWSEKDETNPELIPCDREVRKIIFSPNSNRIIHPKILVSYCRKLASEQISL